MQKGIHPAHGPVAFRDQNTGTTFVTRSTLTPRETTVVDGVEYPVINVEISSDSHPFWTGTARVNDTEGRVTQFNRRFGRGRDTMSPNTTSKRTATADAEADA